MFITSEQDIREWILFGAPRSESERNRYDDHQMLVPMPAYEEYLSDGELDDLVSYFLAVSGWRPEIPDSAYEGRRIATRLGCFGCHGPSGMGGVANPGSFKGLIPPWDGEEFEELVHDEEELREWILYGKIERLWSNPAARFFLDRQKTPMPAYHDFISDAELDLLVNYIQWLRSGSEGGGKQQRDAATVIATITGAN
jgi:mono/diheme cytochrome c family protein